jgi:hypothetical protein
MIVAPGPSRLGFGVYTAVDLALVVDVLPDKDNAAKDLGVINIAGALPFSVAPGIAPAILEFGKGRQVLSLHRRSPRGSFGRGVQCGRAGCPTLVPIPRPCP